MSDSRFGIGLVGAGFISRDAHAPSVDYLSDVHIAGIQNRTRENAVDLAETCREHGRGDPSVYGAGELAELAHDPEVDGIWIATPNFTRTETVDTLVDAVESGATLQGIALEKPIARTLPEARHLIDRIESVDLPHAYLENWIHEPDIKDLRSLLWQRGRDAGRPYLARSQAEHGGPHSGWFWDGQKQGGGALTDMLCHSLGGNDYLLRDPEAEGQLEPVSVTADTETLKWARESYAEELQERYGVDYEEHPSEDYARVTVRYEDAAGNPVVSEATGSWCFVGSGVSRHIELLGPEYSGQVRSDDDSSSVFFSDALGDGDGWAEKQTATSGRMPIAAATVVTGGFVAENRDAIRAFSAGENATFDLFDGERILRLCMAAYKAAEDGTRVELADASLDSYTPPPAR
ncbi:Gfo/Idh/MocA family protein [Halobaculum lipolyticum]|uniref:Gfo/Idh/MocA family protein n=1 Tax=Halobaculum lipolyticum TaxID=3032001 RepID=A0ABD5WB51_9EURY|nr:Gfo/Idh/MocA family oxidoreductase [Halobaculum sp. DT31]